MFKGSATRRPLITGFLVLAALGCPGCEEVPGSRPGDWFVPPLCAHACLALSSQAWHWTFEDSSPLPRMWVRYQVQAVLGLSELAALRSITVSKPAEYLSAAMSPLSSIVAVLLQARFVLRGEQGASILSPHFCLLSISLTSRPARLCVCI